MKNKGIIIFAVLALIVSIISFFTVLNMNTLHSTPQMNDMTSTPGNTEAVLNEHNYAKGLISPNPGQPVKQFSLTAQESVLLLSDGLTLPVWTYNGSVPGPEIRVTKGDYVQVALKNELGVPVTIHWHGYPLNQAMDGVPGINQDSVKPGETFLYEFSADTTGTYWYHSHQEGSKQVDKGLYGSLIVEDPKESAPDKDFTLILDEWMANPEDEMDMSGMNMGSQVDPVLAEEEMMSQNYNIYTVNGKTGRYISPLEVRTGDTVRLRFINAGYRSHGIHLPDQDFIVISTDGQSINGGAEIRNQILTIAPGERYDIEFTITNDKGFYIDAHDQNIYNNQILIPVIVTDGSGEMKIESEIGPVSSFDLTKYGTYGSGTFSLSQKYDKDYYVELNTNTSNGDLEYTINGKTFDELPPLELVFGQTVKLTYVNESKVDHPMHLHGHFFEILSKNGMPASGALITKDTLLVRPGETYVVAFKADNPGNWVQHCHELHHAAAGMMQSVIYMDFKSNYIPDPNNKDNNPE